MVPISKPFRLNIDDKESIKKNPQHAPGPAARSVSPQCRQIRGW
jgi:hypothetical protein